jgi:hypothetical protein
MIVTGFKNACFHFYFFFLKSATFVAVLQSTLHILEGPTQIFTTQTACHTV